MTKKTKLTRIAAAVALTLGMSGVALAETSSSMRGQIVDPQGQVVADTRVIIEHIPSGTTTTATTNESGTFVAAGLRVGGPYRVIIESESFEAQTIEDIFLQLGTPYRLNAELETEREEQYERIAVTGRAINTTSLQAGSASTWGENEIRTLPTFNRDLKDIVRQNPLATQLGDDEGSLTVAGNNPRFNSITVDGVGQNDDFGLNGNGYPTQRSPISIDAIEQVSIQSVPFNARYSGFTGARVNAVTKSGDNTFSGSVFMERADDDMAGSPDASRYTPDANDPELQYTEETYGFSLGGPILRDKLFFFVNYEKYEEPQSVEQGPLGSNTANTKNIDPAVIARVQDISQNVYGVNAGEWNVRPVLEDEKVLAKIDWNINNDHRSSFTYQRTEGNSTRNNTPGGRSTMNLSSNWYNNSQLLETYTGQLYSNWTNNFSTEIKASVKEVTTGQDPLLGKEMGAVTIEFTEAESGEAGTEGSINIGPDRSRHANRLETTTTEFQFHGEYLLNDHQIQFGTEYQNIDVFNVFVQNSLGVFSFDSLEDFENQQAAQIQYQNAFTNNASDGAAEFEYANFATYIQDTWDVTWDLTLNFGLRYERLLSDDSPAFNQQFVDRYGFDNTTSMDGLDLWLPRASFSYNLTDQMTLRGGVGRFSGGRPNVWISNAYTNDGVTIVAADNLFDVSGADITEVPQSMQDQLQAGDGNTTPIDPNYEPPVDTRYSLALDYSDLDLGFAGEGWFASAEVIYTDKEREVRWVNLNKRPLLDESGNQVTTAGGRPLYVSYDPLSGTDYPTEIGELTPANDRMDILLTNATGGRSIVSTFSLGNAWDNGLSFRASYTNQDVRDITAGGSSTAHSNYNFQTAIDKQNPQVGTASYEIEHRFMATLNYVTEIFAGYDSSFSLFWDRTSGRPYSNVVSTFRDPSFGDPSTNNLWSSSNYLAYIPTGPDDPAVTYGNGFSYDQFMANLEAAGIDAQGGAYTPRNGMRGPWNTNLDFRFEQEIPGFMEGHRGSFYVDVRNVLAIFTDNQRHEISFADTGNPVAETSVDPETGQYVYVAPFGGFDATPPAFYNPRASTWTAKIGVRYAF